MKFDELDLHPALFAAINELGFESLTSIQESCYEPIVNGKDIAGLSQTGTGKTAAFLIPLIQRLLLSKPNAEQRLTSSEVEPMDADPRVFPKWTPNNFILVVVPTRELAEQVSENVELLGGKAGLKPPSLLVVRATRNKKYHQ
ncbi:MAG: DEAD/DEAH box helicase [Bdellovibrionales bacterium]